jgi:thiol-disulfide isomerase/thioredoxin|tara:strand:- start:808 stop:1434 length:627 start_codon:yes stop_codon:yes gene_type:complete
METKCKRCGQVFRNNKGLSRHIKDKHAVHYYAIRIIPIAIVLGAIITFLYFFGNITPLSNDVESTPQEDIFFLQLPVVTAEGLTNQSIRLGDLGGRPIVLEFMLSWCSHCQTMAPIVEEVYAEYGLSTLFLSVAGSQNGATAESTAEFIRTYNSTLTHVFDEQTKVFNHFGITGTPTYLFFNSDGTLANTVSGEMTKSALISEVTRLS